MNFLDFTDDILACIFAEDMPISTLEICTELRDRVLGMQRNAMTKWTRDDSTVKAPDDARTQRELLRSGSRSATQVAVLKNRDLIARCEKHHHTVGYDDDNDDFSFVRTFYGVYYAFPLNDTMRDVHSMRDLSFEIHWKWSEDYDSRGISAIIGGVGLDVWATSDVDPRSPDFRERVRPQKGQSVEDAKALYDQWRVIPWIVFRDGRCWSINDVIADMTTDDSVLFVDFE